MYKETGMCHLYIKTCNRKCLWQGTNMELEDKDIKVDIINMLKEWKENTPKELKENRSKIVHR